MKRLYLLTVIAALLLGFSTSVYAQEEAAKYNFATAQGAKEISVIPGGETRGQIYFYNIDGNRITHVSLTVKEGLAGWDITILPPLGETTVLVNEAPVTVTENLYVEPSLLLTEEPQSVPEGVVSLTVPGRGFGRQGYFRLTFCVAEAVIAAAAPGFARAREKMAT